jgi:hypothetical protein
MVTLLREVAAIDDEHAGLEIAECLRHQRLVAREERLVVPGADADELLQRLDIAALHGQGQRLDRLPLQVQQLPGEGGPRPVALLRPAEQRGKLRVVGNKLISQRRDVARH